MHLTLTPTLYSGFNVTCFGKKDGAINLTVTGGASPYTFTWSNGATTEDVSNLTAGYYTVLVRDRNNEAAEASITLSTPEPLALDFYVSSFPNGYNISCFECYNGAILLDMTGGTGSYIYIWEDGPTTQDRFDLGEGSYFVTIEDGNQCVLRPENFYISAPPRSDWTLNGNANLVDSVNFIGSMDSSNVLFKANNQTLLKLNADGNVSLPDLAPGPMYLDINRNIITPTPCSSPSLNLPATWTGNTSGVIFSCHDHRVGVGDDNVPVNVKFMVSGTTWMDGTVGIGIDPNTANLTSGSTAYKLLVNGKMGAGEIYCSVGNPWPDYVFSDEYHLMPLKELKEYIKVNKHLPGVPSAAEMQASGVNVYEQLAKAYEKIEELYLHLLEMEERISALTKQ